MTWTTLIAAVLMGQAELGAASSANAPHIDPSVDGRQDIARGGIGGCWDLPSSDLRLSSYSAAPRFGERGSRRWQVHGGFGVDVKNSSNRIGLAGVGVSYFLIDNLSLDAELNGLFVNQRGNDALAGNINLLFRWHFVARETWSIYGDAGAGMALSSKRVPAHGTRFNFTPQVGVGASFDIGDDMRLMIGLRWHHISNANLYSENPGRDSILTYVGVSFGF